MEKDLKQLFIEYTEECNYSKGLRPQTITGYKATFKLFSMIMPENTTVESLTRDTMVEFFKRIKTRTRTVGKNTLKVGLKDSTIKTYANKLNAFFVWLFQRGLIVKNPLSDIKIKYPEYTDERALDDEEVRKILTAVSLNSNNNSLILRRDTAIIYLLFFCGLRKGELLGLRVIDINKDKLLLMVQAATSKSKKIRYIPMNPTLAFHLQEYINERNKQNYKTAQLIVSSTQDKGLSAHGLKHWVNKLKKSSGVNFHLHRFRHTFAMNLAKKNVPYLVIQKAMGHRDFKMTMSYLRSFTVEDVREGINSLSI